MVVERVYQLPDRDRDTDAVNQATDSTGLGNLANPIAATSDIGFVKSAGQLELGFSTRGELSELSRSLQSGCLRVRRLNTGLNEIPTMAVINTAGGLTGGDRLDMSVRWDEGSAACVTTPAAEKIYRSVGSDAKVSIRLQIAAHATAEFLPQETILFDGGRLDREMHVHLEGNASAIVCDGVVFGRLARGEHLNAGHYCETLKVWRDGRLVLFDRTDVDGHLYDWLSGASTGRDNRAAGMVLVAVAESQAMLVSIREAVQDAEGLVGASIVQGLIHVRLMAAGDAELRRDMARILATARDGRPLPRNWSF